MASLRGCELLHGDDSVAPPAEVCVAYATNSWKEEEIIAPGLQDREPWVIENLYHKTQIAK